jgi:predicted SAM-dependent methyltransferase
MKYIKAIISYFRLKKNLRTTPVANIVVGASGVYEEGWIPTDVHTLNLLKPKRWLLFFKPDTINAILAEHVWEHLSPEDGQTGAATCYMFLKKSGYLRIAVPDGFHPSKEYINYVKPGGSGAGADDHKALYNYRSLSTMLEKCGFSVRLLEYFDEAGKFHFNAWDRKEGMIHRSSRYDERNSNAELNYTSLIIDAVK